MSANEAIFDVVMRACSEQALNPDRFGGGIIGRAAAVVQALGVDGAAPLSRLKAARLPAEEEGT